MSRLRSRLVVAFLLGLAFLAAAFSVRRGVGAISLASARRLATAGDSAGAQKSIRDALRFAGRDPQILVPAARGAVAGTWGAADPATTANIVSWSLETCPLYGRGWLLATQWSLARGDVLAARFAIERALRLEPTSPRVHLMAAGLSLRDGDYEAFRAGVIKAQALGEVPDFEELPWRGNDAIPSRISALEEKQKLYPSRRVDVVVEIAALLERQGRVTEARERLDRARADAGRWVWKLDFADAAIRARSGDVSAAVRMLEARLGDRRLRPEESSQLANLAAEVLCADPASDPARAEAAVRQAIRLTPGFPDPSFKLAAYFGQRGECGRAVEWARHGASVRSDDPAVWRQAAELAVRCSRPAMALGFLERAAAVDPTASSGIAYLDLAFDQENLAGARTMLSDLVARYPEDRRLLPYGERLQLDIARKTGVEVPPAAGF